MPLPHVPADVKFDAVSGDYYPIIYFNDYWNLQKDYYPINESLASLPLRVSFCPLSLWRWQLYAAQSTKSPWNFLGDELYEQSDEEQDSVKVRRHGGFPAPSWAARRGSGPAGSLGTSSPSSLPSFATSRAPSPQQTPAGSGGPVSEASGGLLVILVTAFLSPQPGLSGLDLHPRPQPVSLTLGSDSEPLLPLTTSLNVFCSHLSLGLHL